MRRIVKTRSRSTGSTRSVGEVRPGGEVRSEGLCRNQPVCRVLNAAVLAPLTHRAGVVDGVEDDAMIQHERAV